MSDDLLKRLLEFRSNQYADSNTAPEFVFLDPDLPPSQWDKQYGMDVVYVRGDVMWLNLKEQADRIEELEAEVARLRQLVPRPDQTEDELVWRDHMRGVPLAALAKEFGVTKERMRHRLKRIAENKLHLKGKADE